jgi:hypothetical protein
MMVYPDVAPQTKRDTFVTIANFCGGMAVVMILSACLGMYSALATLIQQGLTSIFRTTLMELMILMIAYFLFRRSISFEELADCIVVNYFLNKYGANFRSLKQDETTKQK